MAIIAALSPMAAQGQKESNAAERIDASTDVLTDMMHANDKGIPQDLMDKATCVIIVPNMKKAGFIFGAKYGRGFAMCRRSSGHGWSSPAGIRIEGGSFGLQIGGTEQDAVLLVMNETGMKHLISSKFTLGADATVAAGPVGRAATAQTDATMRAETLSYSRARGIFAGIVLTSHASPGRLREQGTLRNRSGNRAILMGVSRRRQRRQAGCDSGSAIHAQEQIDRGARLNRGRREGPLSAPLKTRFGWLKNTGERSPVLRVSYGPAPASSSILVARRAMGTPSNVVRTNTDYEIAGVTGWRKFRAGRKPGGRAEALPHAASMDGRG